MLLSKLDKLARFLVSSLLRSILEAKAFLRGTSTGIAGGFPNQSKPPVNWWFALPLKGAITGLTPIRGSEYYYRITRTATR